MKAFAKAALLLGLTGLIGVGVTYLFKESLIIVDRIELIESETATPTNMILFQRIRSALQPELDKYQGQPVWEISLRKLLSFASSDPRVKDVSVRRIFPNRIQMIIQPRSPLLALLDVKGRLHPIANDASFLPALSPAEGPDLPILRGLNFFDGDTERQQVVKLMEVLPEQGEFSRQSVSEVRLNKREGYEFYLSSGMKVIVGEQLDQDQVSRVEQVLNYLKSRSVKSRVIDARFSKKVVVRVRNAS